MKRLLWLDDLRNPKLADWLMCYAPEFAYGEGEVHWVKKYSEFVDWITENGLPDLICFDHDLSDIHYNKSTYKEKTGFTCAQWLVDYCINNDKMIPAFRIQSANPVGKANIEGLLNGAIKHLTK
jgi:hypothetical protein